MTHDEMERWIDAMAVSHLEHGERMAAHEEQMQTMREQLKLHAERIAYNEETQRRVSNALQALREILGRENGR